MREGKCMEVEGPPCSVKGYGKHLVKDGVVEEKNHLECRRRSGGLSDTAVGAHQSASHQPL